MAPITTILNNLITSVNLRGRSPSQSESDLSSLGPLVARSVLTARVVRPEVDGIPGAILPQDVNNNALFALFGLIPAFFVIGGIWFFFWAPNGGFHFRNNDWDDYKSTVLRRRGPNGTLLTGATPSTILGGGSVYKDVDDGTTDDTRTVMSGTTGITGVTEGASDIAGRERRRKKREQKDREKERRREEKAREKEEYRRNKSRRKVGVDGALIDEDAEADAKAQLRNYRHEKAARVGGINKESEGSSWDGSTNPSYSSASGSGVGSSTTGTGTTVTSDLMGNRERTPTSTPTKKDAADKEKSGGIRKVYSTADKTSAREKERIRAEARKLREESRAAERARQKRDFSWQQQPDESAMALRRIDELGDDDGDLAGSHAQSSLLSEPRVPGSWGPESSVGSASDVGTKVYHHSVHIPVPSSTATSDFAYQDEKRKKRAAGAGNRRG
ncbi:hypothetical protein B0T22DRAFT_225149 [Podospora appendiculata]|uniref:Endosomal spry domain-containing protein n=1 Tax=Podospora appendiculata TaxID=314037 RepID=A0AAE1CAM1_9PEZI|nr:hypothetical protein B0T22DRAFT_225149 [Podospora appendiculata]